MNAIQKTINALNRAQGDIIFRHEDTCSPEDFQWLEVIYNITVMKIMLRKRLEEEAKMHDVMFVGMNIENEVKKLVNSKEKIITNGMNESELRAYRLGIKNTISAIDTVFNSEDDYTAVVQVKWLDKPEEFTFEDINALFEDNN